MGQADGILSLIPWAPRSSTTTPKHELGASSAWGYCSLLMPGPAEHLKESQLEAVTCQHLLGAHLALLPREIPASLYPVILSFWLNFCYSPHAVPSCCPATVQGGVSHPSCSTAFPARWRPVLDRALLASCVRQGGRCPSPGLPFPDGASSLGSLNSSFPLLSPG